MHLRPEAGVLLVDDHPVVREALAQVLKERGIAVGGQASGRREALAQVALQRPGLALVDLSLGSDDGLVLVNELQILGIPVVVCSNHEEREHVQRALAAGAKAYITKREANRDLAHVVDEVLKGWVVISPRAAEDLFYSP